MLAFCEGWIAAYKALTVVEIRESAFPRTDTGKIQKSEVQDELIDANV